MELLIARMHSSNKAYGSGFMMLSTNLYGIFVRYIQEGRVRAPPANELGELSPTFQYGAKTDRRALQSKFKSWAKRMALLDGRLVIASSGKIILPREQCESVIRQLHFQNEEHHLAFEQVVIRIQEIYTWSRKNFGMDWNIVASTIPAICNREVCLAGFQLTYGLQRSRQEKAFHSNSSTSSNSFSDSKEFSRLSFGQMINNNYTTPPNQRSIVVFPTRYSNPQVAAKLFSSGSCFGEPSMADSQKIEFLKNLKLAESECNKPNKRKRSFPHKELILPPFLFSPTDDKGSNSFTKTKNEQEGGGYDSRDSPASIYVKSNMYLDSMLKSSTMEYEHTPNSSSLSSKSMYDKSTDVTSESQRSSSLASFWSPIASSSTQSQEWILPTSPPPWLVHLKNINNCYEERISPEYVNAMDEDENMNNQMSHQTTNVSKACTTPTLTIGFEKAASIIGTSTPILTGTLKEDFSFPRPAPSKQSPRTPTALWRPDPETMGSNVITVKEERMSPDIIQIPTSTTLQTPVRSSTMTKHSIGEFMSPLENFSIEKDMLLRYYSMCSSFHLNDSTPATKFMGNTEMMNTKYLKANDISENNDDSTMSQSKLKGTFYDKLEELWLTCDDMQLEFKQILWSLIVEDEERVSLQELQRKIDEALRLVRDIKTCEQASQSSNCERNIC